VGTSAGRPVAHNGGGRHLLGYFPRASALDVAEFARGPGERDAGHRDEHEQK
jgi:hypothetical protein